MTSDFNLGGQFHVSSEFAEPAHSYPVSCVSHLLPRISPDISQELLGQLVKSNSCFQGRLSGNRRHQELVGKCTCLPVFEVDRAGLCFELFSIFSRVWVESGTFLWHHSLTMCMRTGFFSSLLLLPGITCQINNLHPSPWLMFCFWENPDFQIGLQKEIKKNKTMTRNQERHPWRDDKWTGVITHLFNEDPLKLSSGPPVLLI